MDDLHRPQQSPQHSPPAPAQSAAGPEAETDSARPLAQPSSQREFILKIYITSAAVVVLLSLAIWLMMRLL